MKLVSRIVGALILVAGPAATAQAASLQSVQPLHPVATMSTANAQRVPKLPHPAYSGPVRLQHRASATEYSSNWAGYATTARSQYRAVYATFTVPYINTLTSQASAGNMASHWVGLDGYGGSSSVEQTGIGEYYEPNFGYGYSFSWWELYPANAMQTLYSVSPGDQIRTDVTWENASYWGDHKPAFRMDVSDTNSGQIWSQGWRFTHYTAPRSSAEVITEVPSSSDGTFALTNYGNLNYQYAGTTTTPRNNLSLASGSGQTSHRILLMNANHQNMAWVSGLTQRGTAFSTPYRQGI